MLVSIMNTIGAFPTQYWSRAPWKAGKGSARKASWSIAR